MPSDYLSTLKAQKAKRNKPTPKPQPTNNAVGMGGAQGTGDTSLSDLWANFANWWRSQQTGYGSAGGMGVESYAEQMRRLSLAYPAARYMQGYNSRGQKIPSIRPNATTTTPNTTPITGGGTGGAPGDWEAVVAAGNYLTDEQIARLSPADRAAYEEARLAYLAAHYGAPSYMAPTGTFLTPEQIAAQARQNQGASSESAGYQWPFGRTDRGWGYVGYGGENPWTGREGNSLRMGWNVIGGNEQYGFRPSEYGERAYGLSDLNVNEETGALQGSLNRYGQPLGYTAPAGTAGYGGYHRGQGKNFAWMKQQAIANGTWDDLRARLAANRNRNTSRIGSHMSGQQRPQGGSGGSGGSGGYSGPVSIDYYPNAVINWRI